MNRIVQALLLLVLFITQGCISDDQPEGPSLSVGDSLPVFSVVLNNGETVSSRSLLGKTSMIVFFNTGCGDCRRELPVVQEIWNLYEKDTSVEVVLIAREETDSEIRRYWDENGFTMLYSPQENRDVYSLFAPSVIPRIYIANPSGIITAAYGDSDLPDAATLQSDINKAS